MSSSISRSDFVLIICTPTYKSKTDARKGGVGYEDSIISSEVLYMNNHRKFIPILRNGGWVEAAPNWLRDKRYIDLSTLPDYEYNYNYLLLLSVLHNISISPPPIGTIPYEKIINVLSPNLTVDIPSMESRKTLKGDSLNAPMLSVDLVMKTLKEANTVGECKIADYNLSKFTGKSDVNRIQYYLFEGDQRQRNYAALYFRRKGDYSIVMKAYKDGKIDKVQARAK